MSSSSRTERGLPRRRRSSGWECASDGRPLIRPYLHLGEQVTASEMAHRRNAARSAHEGLRVLGRIAVDQVHANAMEQLNVLASGLDASGGADDLDVLADAIRHLINERPELARPVFPNPEQPL